MSFRLLSISSMYDGYLDAFYRDYPEVVNMDYREHNDFLMNRSTEFAASYLRHFRKEGIVADSIICNDNALQKKWCNEHHIKPEKNEEVIISQIKSYNPEVLYIENLSFVTSAFLNHVRQEVPSVKLIAANHGAPFNPKVLDSIKAVDFVITCTPGLKTSIEQMGIRSYLVYHGFETSQLEWIDKTADQFENGFIFSGSLITGGDFHSRRIQLIQRILDEGIPIGLYVNLEKMYRIRAKQAIYHFNRAINRTGMGKYFANFSVLKYGKSWVENYSSALMKSSKPPVFGPDMLNLFYHSKVVLNFHIGIAGDYAGNMRMFEVTGVGSCLITDNKKNMPDLFTDGKEVVTYDNDDDCIEKVRWLLDHETERRKIALAGQNRTLTQHTVWNRCKEVIEIFNSALKAQ